MALIKCSECGREVSDKATACIHCGCPITPAAPVNTPPAPRSLSMDFHAVLSGAAGESTAQSVYVEELGRKVEFPLPNNIKAGDTYKVNLQEGSAYDHILFTVASVYQVPKATASGASAPAAAPASAPAPAAAPSNADAIALLKRYDPNWFVNYVRSRRYYTIIVLCIGLLVKLAMDGSEEYIAMGAAITAPLWVPSVLGHIFYPMYHVKKYIRKHNLEDAIRNDTGYMNVAIVAYNANPCKKMLSYIRSLNPSAALRIEQQLAAKKK